MMMVQEKIIQVTCNPVSTSFRGSVKFRNHAYCIGVEHGIIIFNLHRILHQVIFHLSNIFVHPG